MQNRYHGIYSLGVIFCLVTSLHWICIVFELFDSSFGLLSSTMSSQHSKSLKKKLMSGILFSMPSCPACLSPQMTHSENGARHCGRIIATNGACIYRHFECENSLWTTLLMVRQLFLFVFCFVLFSRAFNFKLYFH